MTLLEQIEQEIKRLPLEKQTEALDFIVFLQQRGATRPQIKPRSLRDHPAFGLWRGRNINALKYQQDLRAEWDDRS